MPRTIGTAAGYNNQPNGYFVNEVYSLKLQKKFYARTFLSQITNNTWEGEITESGSKVHIRVIPTVTVKSLVRGENIVYEDLNDDEITLDIDKGIYTAFAVGDIDRAQNDINFINLATSDAVEQARTFIETDFLQNVYGEVAAANVLGTQTLTKANILDFIVDLGTLLHEANVTPEGWWLMLPPWACALIMKSDLRDASIAGDSGPSILRNGRIGVIGRFTIYMSNLLFTDGTDWNILGGTRDFACFASQFTITEFGRRENSFGNYARSMKVYGYKATKPEAGVTAPIRKA